MDSSLERFTSAQAYDYEAALSEVRRGKKTSHWIWYVFPQLRGLGRSEMARYYGISSLKEAKAYLSDPVLGPRLVEISEVLMELKDKDADRIFGGLDAMKVRSCMTLFAEVSEENSVFHRVLEAYFHGEKDKLTIDLLKRAADSNESE